MLPTGPMALEQPQPADLMEPYFTGTQPSGGYWTTLARLSAHDHSGGLLGNPVAVVIPDGSITAADLDPSVLAPYAPTDGTKAFTGLVQMEADALVRDSLYFGEQGTIAATDTFLARTGPGAVRLVGTRAVLDVRFAGNTSGARYGQAIATPGGYLTANAWYDGADWVLDDPAHDGVSLFLHGIVGQPTLRVTRYGAGTNPATGRAKTPLSLGSNGTLTLTPDAGSNALVWEQGSLRQMDGDPTSVQIGASGRIFLEAIGNAVDPARDNAISLGQSSNRWSVVYAGAGAINTSNASQKQEVAPLDPALCLEACREVVWYEFAYRPPAFTPPEPPPDTAYDASDSNEVKAEKKAVRDTAEAEALAAHARMLVETAPARHQRGFVFPDTTTKDEAGNPLPPVPELFGLSDRQSTTPQADLATIGCALQEVLRRLELLEAGGAA